VVWCTPYHVVPATPVRPAYLRCALFIYQVRFVSSFALNTALAYAQGSGTDIFSIEDAVRHMSHDSG